MASTLVDITASTATSALAIRRCRRHTGICCVLLVRAARAGIELAVVASFVGVSVNT